MKISIIVAVANNYAIGKDNKLLCHLPADLKHFKLITSGQAVIMGKNTFLSLPNGALPNRKNIVITDNRSDTFASCTTVFSIEDALKVCEKDEEVFIIGGASIYRQFMPIADYLYITYIHHDFEADTFFPVIDSDIWQETLRVKNDADEKNKFSFSFVNYKRN